MNMQKIYSYTNPHGQTFTLTLDQIDTILGLHNGGWAEAVTEAMSLIGMEKEAFAWQQIREKISMLRKEQGQFQRDAARKEGKADLFGIALAGIDTPEYKQFDADLEALRKEGDALWSPIEQAMNGVREACLTKTGNGKERIK